MLTESTHLDPLDLLSEAIEKGTTIFAKVLARNDSSWADDSQKHQNGPYIPSDIRTTFFPPLQPREDKPHIFDRPIKTIWPQDSKDPRESRLVHYSNKGSESHLTGVPKKIFKGLSPASLLLVWKDYSEAQEEHFVCIIFNSSCDAYEQVFDLLELSPEFISGVIQPNASQGALAGLLDELVTAVETRSFTDLIQTYKIPETKRMAATAQDYYINARMLPSLSPFELDAPGNALADLVELEYSQFRKHELRLRVAQIAEALFNRRVDRGGSKAVILALISGFEDLLGIFKSIRGSRSTRAGTSFELHIRRMLRDGKIPHEYQAVIDKRSPDFVLPSVDFFTEESRKPDEALILTAKTTTRERWMQILNEARKRDVWFLATLDRTISKNVLTSLAKANVVVVVPERYKKPTREGKGITEYENDDNVISFRFLFENKLKPRMLHPRWILAAQKMT